MSAPIIAILCFSSATIIALLATRHLILWLTTSNIMAIPNDRSCHVDETPVGGGWVLFILAFSAWFIFIIPMQSPYQIAHYLLAVGMFCLTIISWLDDKNFVSPLLRFTIQIIMVVSVLIFLPNQSLVFQGILPLSLDRLLTGFLWIWFINLYNFMDGIDGLAGSQTLFITLGLALIGAVIGLSPEYGFVQLVIAGASLGFLYWNWHPAKIFMGDVGAIIMGYILGWFLIHLALQGYLISALILPLYFVFDASWTLLRRIYHKEKFLQPHRTHFYQRAARKRESHSEVVCLIIIANLFLLGASLWALTAPFQALIMAVIMILILIYILYSPLEKLI